MAHRLSSYAARGSVLDQGSNHVSCVGRQILDHEPPGKPSFFLNASPLSSVKLFASEEREAEEVWLEEEGPGPAALLWTLLSSWPPDPQGWQGPTTQAVLPGGPGQGAGEACVRSCLGGHAGDWPEFIPDTFPV